jgi:hypothetical protein
MLCEPDHSGLRSAVAEASLDAVLPQGVPCRTEAWSLDAALILAPGPGESVLEASRRIDGICRGAYQQMDRRASDLRQARRTGLWKSAAPVRGGRRRVACP